MRILVSVADDVFEKYVAQTASGSNPADTLSERLTRFVDCDRRTLVLQPAERRAIEGLAGRSIENPAELVNEFRKMCRVKIGDVERTFDAAELQRIAEQASFHGQTPEQFIQANVNDIIERLMDRV